MGKSVFMMMKTMEMKTKTKTETIMINKCSTLSRDLSCVDILSE